MSHHKDSDRPRKFRDIVGKGKLDSTPIEVPPDFNAEVGTIV